MMSAMATPRKPTASTSFRACSQLSGTSTRCAGRRARSRHGRPNRSATNSQPSGSQRTSVSLKHSVRSGPTDALAFNEYQFVAFVYHVRFRFWKRFREANSFTRMNILESYYSMLKLILLCTSAKLNTVLYKLLLKSS